jgi:hypothetical protein
MNDQGKLTAGTSVLILAGIVLAFVGGALAPDGQVYTWLLIGAWICAMQAFNSVHGKIRKGVWEREIRDDERQKLAGGQATVRQMRVYPPQDRRPGA